MPDFVDALDAARADEIGDDLLRLIFTACHPVLSTEARVALTLKLLGGLTTHEIARAFLVPEPTIAQRIVRAKRTLAEARCRSRCRAAMQLARAAGLGAGSGLPDLQRRLHRHRGRGLDAPGAVREALRLGRMLAELAPGEPEVHGLVALMELQASRTARARGCAAARPVLLLEQDRARWDRLLIRRGLAALERAEALARSLGQPLGPYALQAAIAACHARARTADADRLGAHRRRCTTRWRRSRPRPWWS